MLRAGVGLLIPGLVLTSMGTVFTTIGSVSYTKVTYDKTTGKVLNVDDVTNQSYYDMYVAGAVMLGVGVPMLAGSIPLIVLGKNYEAKSAEVYNENARKKASDVSVSLNWKGTGLGLAVNF